ncbi:hypothetical protein J3R30DRAFT_3560747 [Lentinula aciculospora]|uniref:Uncharacterized protein n=1 Tax=Lentinula aciculospora TaxID=153920 RepID=A0A9W8ZWP1_9AGAR|nr:hypothetical protein J3R30DRAFT_3560747 [Lentinula aciculospora]
MSTTILRSALPQSPRSTIVSQSLSIIRKLIATEEFRVGGLTTAEMYRLALKEVPPPNFEKYQVRDNGDTEIQYTKSGQRKTPPPNPPHMEHPIRSMRFLKTQLLPILEGLKEIRMTTGKRFHAIPEAKPDLGKTKTKATKGKGKGNGKTGVDGHSILSSSSPVAPVSHTVHLWMPTQKPKVVRDKITSPKTTQAFGAEVGLGADWDHLNKRRQSARDEKIKHDLLIVSQVRKAEKQERKRLVWEAAVDNVDTISQQTQT